MQTTNHSVTHYFQPTNDSCGYTALAILLSHYQRQETPEAIIEAVPQAKPAGAEGYGSITSQIATWCLDQGFKVELTTFDFLIIDLEWAKLQSPAEVIARLEAIKDSRDVKVIGKNWSKVYVEEYIKYLQAGGALTIKPHVSSALLYHLLAKGPVYINICAYVAYDRGRTLSTGLRKNTFNDIEGGIFTHSVVLYGNDAAGNFLVADPWEGLTVIHSETMLAAVTAAEIECDAMCFQISRA